MPGAVSRVMASTVRRTALVLGLALPVSSWMIILAAVPQASACSDSNSSNHCYAIAENFNTNTNHGVYGEINVHCLYQPNNGNQARAEIWDTSSGGTYWIEGGVISGVDYNGAYRNKAWVWADQRPGFNYSEHDKAVTANTDTTYPTEIIFAGSGTWDVYGENSFVLFGTSTNNSATLVEGMGGTEYEGGSASGIRDIGDVYNLERRSSSNVWYSWGNNAQDFDLGPGNYINGHYVTGAHEYWNGPC